MKPSTNLVIRLIELAFLFAYALPVMLIWNAVVTVVFGITEISYLQSLSLLFLWRIFIDPLIK
jgi:hypothetical protein